MGKCHQDNLRKAGTVEGDTEAVGEEEQVILNNIITARDQATMVTEVMVGGMGGPEFENVWVEMRVISNAAHLPLGSGKPSDRHTTLRA